MADSLQQDQLRSSEREKIRAAVNDIALVDGHAHNLVELESSHSFVHAFSEAQGVALADVPHTVSFKRGVEDIARLYNVRASLESIVEFRQKTNLAALTATCFRAANISTVLLDDGLALDKMKDLAWHKEVVGDVHRVLRIESVAETMLSEGPHGGGDKWTFDSFKEQYLTTLKSQASSVVAFKTIAAYRSGLNINPLVTEGDAEEGLMQTLGTQSTVRLTNKNLTDWIFTRSLELATIYDIPMQIHTGFGDKDLDLQLANPLLLRAVLEDSRFEHARIVLLHSSYPYMRQAAYLSSVYPQVFLDFGLAIPKLSVRGMISAVAELLELAPINKVMFSTDAYGFPETFYLGAKWSRTVLADVLCVSFDDGDLTVEGAIAAAHSMLRLNSLAFYKLKNDERLGNSSATVSDNNCKTGTNASQSSEKVNSSWPCLREVKYVRLMWGDASGQRRCRVVPTTRYKSVVATNGVGLTECCMAMSSHSDGPAPGSGLSAVGEIRLIPDPSTLLEVPDWKHGLVLVDMHVKPGTPWELCPRTTLRRLAGLLENEFQLVLRAGFEIEFYLLKKTTEPEKWEGVDFTPYCSTSGLTQSLGTLDCMLSWLSTMQIDIEQFHAEAGGGQFEFALGHEPALKAGDSLLLAREAITAAAINQNLLATFLPKVHLKNTMFGSGSHVHVSLWKEGKNVFSAESGADSYFGMSETGKNFLAGVLQHLPAILAFTAPHPNSYKRIQPNTWSGAFQCWGQENREAPLRTSSPPDAAHGIVTNFELKSFDGCANPHLGLAAVIAAGLDGLRKKLQLPPPVDVNPAELEKEKQVPRLPTKLEEAAQSLEEDDTMRKLLGEKLVKSVIAIRRAEADYYLRRSQENLVYQY